MAEIVLNVVSEDPQADADLRRGEPGTRRVKHRLGEILDQLAELGVEITDRLGRGAQHRVAEKADRLDATI